MATVESKPCSVCKQTLPAATFSPDNRAKTGLQPACKKCATARRLAKRWENIEAEREKERARYHRNPGRREKNNQWRKANRDKVLEGRRRWYEKVKDTPEYRAYVKSRREMTKEQKRQYDRERRAANPEYALQKAKEWNRRNPDKRKAIMFNYGAKRRAWKASGLTGVEVRDWAAKQKKVCYWCGIRCAKSYHVDHYVPLSRGGAHELDNLVISCGPCNIKKNAKDPIEFAQSIGKLL